VCSSDLTADSSFVGVDTFEFKVNDGAVDSNVATVTINVIPSPPTITSMLAASPNPATPLQTVQFTCVATDIGSHTVLNWSWDFGDGATGTGVTASHNYTAAGNYSVTLTVTDDSALTGTARHSVTVLPPPAATPTFSPAPGTYSSIQAVTIGSTSSGATIRYTTDGSTPSETAGTVYSGPVQIAATTTLRAIAYGNGFGDSGIASGTYTLQPVLKDRISDVRSLGNGSLVSMTSAKVAIVASGAYSDGSIYISEPDRTWGMKVLNAGTVNLWDNLTILGTIDADSATGEKILRSTSVTKTGITPLVALGMNNKALTSSARLVTVWGKVTGVTSSYLTLDDGSGTPANVEIDGLVTPLASIPSLGDYVSATGPAGIMAGGATAVRLRSLSDIQDCKKSSTPTFSPTPGTYSSAQTITISANTGGATIRYTTDGSTPSETNGTVGNSVTISSSGTLKAIAYRNGLADSDVASGDYQIVQIQCATPTFSPPAGSYAGAQTVTISTTTSGATIRYTTDGSTPSQTNGAVGTSVTVSSSCALKAIAYMANAIDSGVASAAYTIQSANQTFDIVRGLYDNTRRSPDTTWQGLLTTQTGSDGWWYRIDTTSTNPSSGTHGASYAFPSSISSYPLCPIVFGPGSANYAYGWGGQTATGALNMQKGFIGNSDETATFQFYKSTIGTTVGFEAGWQTTSFPTMVVEWKASNAGTASVNLLCYSQVGSNQGAEFILGLYQNGVFSRYLASTTVLGPTNSGVGNGTSLAASGIAMNAGDSIVIVNRSAQFSLYGTRQMVTAVSGGITFSW
jgi:PKD repeat protein